jgi:hypothetical protein
MSTIYNLKEGSEQGDLRNLLGTSLHIDEYKSKMGDDNDICVISIKVTGKEPAEDLVSFIEKGYDWVLDADVSSGEVDDGDFLVFVEAERGADLPESIFKMMEDIMNLTEQSIEEWTIEYPKTQSKGQLTIKDLRKLIPLSPEDYLLKVEQESIEVTENIERLKLAAGLPVTKTAPINELTDALRVAAGIK